VHPITLRAVQLRTSNDVAQTPGLQCGSADAMRITANWSKPIDDAFDDDLVAVVKITKQGNCAIAAWVLAHDAVSSYSGGQISVMFLLRAYL
jgi:hypothetical protein